ncbi:hypothetical protein [Sphingobacterium spiritivorum]
MRRQKFMPRVNAFAAVMLPLLLCAGVLITGCKSSRQVPATTAIIQQDTIRVTSTIRIRDTILVTQPAKASMDIQVEDLKEGFVLKNSSRNATVSARVTSGKLNMDCICDSLSIYAQLRDKMIQTDTQRRLTITKTVSKEIKFIPWYIRVLAWLGGISLIIIVGRILLKRIKLIKWKF